jgi:hypothetical protein
MKNDIVKVLRGKYALDYDEKTLDQFCNEAADEIEKLREVLEHTVTLFEQILDAIDADPVETMLVLRKNGVEVERITASQCFNKARTLLGEKE